METYMEVRQQLGEGVDVLLRPGREVDPAAGANEAVKLCELRREEHLGRHGYGSRDPELIKPQDVKKVGHEQGVLA
jgi:hypothetical protein